MQSAYAHIHGQYSHRGRTRITQEAKQRQLAIESQVPALALSSYVMWIPIPHARDAVASRDGRIDRGDLARDRTNAGNPTNNKLSGALASPMELKAQGRSGHPKHTQHH